MKLRSWGLQALILPCAILLGTTLSCSGPEPPAEVVIGVVLPTTANELPSSTGALLAAEHINDAGGLRLGDRRAVLRILVKDSELRPEAAVSKALGLINREGAVALVGVPVSSNAIPVAALAEQYRVPLIATMSTHPETTRDKTYVFRMAYLNSQQGAAIARFAFNDLNARRAATWANVARIYSSHLSKVFGQAFENLGGELVAVETFTDEDMNLSDALARLRDSAPDVIFMPNQSTTAQRHMRLAREMGIKSIFLGGDLWNMTSMVKPPLTEAYFVDVWAPDDPSERAAAFLGQYEKAFGQAPSTSAVLAYDAVFLLADAMERAGESRPEAIRNEIATLETFDGVSGTLRFEGSGDPQRSLYIRRINADGTLSLHKRIDPTPARKPH